MHGSGTQFIHGHGTEFVEGGVLGSLGIDTTSIGVNGG